ncbi:PadR family transcriptional regulator [Planosporangium thailandense]|uniref:PadR family transcriptional regulator n=1 Tax=Planosporangium thailandense TaxID=765197 RepID=A0ABX0XS61_9ACTN|nr:PadR family transcriptional regulator [Planosporangium thailandense]
MASRGRTNPLALAVLTLLYERPMHPYEMSSTLRERGKEDSIKLNYGSLYSVIESLRKRGLVTTQEVVRSGRRPERTVYALTAAGKAEMIDWLSDLVAQPVKEFPQFEAALSLLPTLPLEDAIRLLESRLRRQTDIMQTGDAMLANARDQGFPRLLLIESEFRQALLKAEIRYIRTLVDELKSGELTGVDFWRRMDELRNSGLPREEVAARVADMIKEGTTWLDGHSND